MFQGLKTKISVPPKERFGAPVKVSITRPVLATETVSAWPDELATARFAFMQAGTNPARSAVTQNFDIQPPGIDFFSCNFLSDFLGPTWRVRNIVWLKDSNIIQPAKFVESPPNSVLIEWEEPTGDNAPPELDFSF